MRRTVPRLACLSAAVALLTLAPRGTAQIPAEPEIGYISPPGGRAGTAVDVRLGIYDWTPDLQFFVGHPRVRLEITGPPTRLLFAGPPYFLDQKAFNPLPIPREVPGRLVVPADVPGGVLRWQIANANGGSRGGMFAVGSGPEVVEGEQRTGPQDLASLPVTVSGRLLCNEEVDRYCFKALRDGPVTCLLTARGLGSRLNGVLEVRDAGGRLLADVADTRGEDPALTFTARAGRRYTVGVHDLDFRGHRSFVYRLELTPGPRVLAALPAAGRRGETRPVTFVGMGVATGAAQLERTTRQVSFPRDAAVGSFPYRLETPFGTSPPFRLSVSDLPELVKPARQGNGVPLLDVPAAVTGSFHERFGTDRYAFRGSKGEVWDLAVEARRLGSPLDVTLAVRGPDGKELAGNDDLPGTSDAGLQFTVPADGRYEIVVGDQSGMSGTPGAVYRLVVQHPGQGDFALGTEERLDVPIGGKAELTVKATRTPRFRGPIAIAIQGLPPGVTCPRDLVLAANQVELKVPLRSAADAAAMASLVSVLGTAQIGGRTVTRTARALASDSPTPGADEHPASTILVTATMKPRVKIQPAESDKRTVHAGTTHLAEVVLDRLEGFDGEITVQMASRQPSKFRQGVLGPDVRVPPGASRVLYPCFVPEGREASDCYRTALAAVVRVPDGHGIVRHLMTRMHHDVTIGLTIEGPILTVTHGADDLGVRPGSSFAVPVKVFRSAKLAGPVRLELRPGGALARFIRSEPVTLGPEKSETVLWAASTPTAGLAGKRTLTVRATALQRAVLPSLCPVSDNTPLDRELLDHLRAGWMPVVAETTVPVDFGAAEPGRREPAPDSR